MRLTVETVAVPMRDGVELLTDVYSGPSNDGRPALLLRTPYPRGLAAARVDAARLVADGWLVVVQSVRGRLGSQGLFNPFRQEREDGRDAVVWCSRHPACDGSVAMTGGSYEGLTQWAAAGAAPEALKAIFPQISARNVRDVWFRSGGVIRQAFLQSWGLSLAFTSVSLDSDAADIVRKLADDVQILYDIDPSHSPLASSFDHYSSWLDPSDDRYWEVASFHTDGAYDAVGVIQVTGWYDIFCEGALADHAEIAASPMRPPRRLIVGPWAHDMAMRQVTGSVNHGIEADGGASDVLGTAHRWMHRYVTGDPVEDGARVFIVGSNRWHELPSWPPPTVAVDLPADLLAGRIVHENGPRVWSEGTAVLRGEHEPLMFPGGRSLDPRRPTPGPFDLMPSIGDRRDIMLLRSAPLTDPLIHVGAATLRLPSCTTNGGPLFGIICWVDPQGRWTAFMEGCINLQPANQQDVALPIGPIAFELAPGWSLGIAVCLSFSSSYWHRSPADDRPYANRFLQVDQLAGVGPTLHLARPTADLRHKTLG